MRLYRVGVFLLGLSAFGQQVYRFQEDGRSHAYQAEVVHDKEGRAAQGGVPVFYDLDNLPAAEKLAKMPASRREALRKSARRHLSNKVHVRVSEADWGKLDETKPVSRKKSTVDGWTVVQYKDAVAAWQAVQWLMKQESMEFAPIFSRQMQKRQSSTLQRQPNDPLYAQQWHLSNQMGVRPRAAWDTVTGKGINMTVIDDGVDIAHEDLAPNAYPLESGYHANFNDGPDDDPSPQEPGQNHGTQCAGLAAARGFNNIGVVGVAPEARLMGLRLIAGENTPDDEAIAFLWQPEGLITHVSSNSWGPTDDGADDGRLNALAKAALQRAVTANRNGLGTVFCFSAGNGAKEGDNSSYDEYSGNRFVIAVGAVTREGTPSSYSEPGMAVALSAFGGEFEAPTTLWTTNNSGPEAHAALREKHESSKSPVNYSDVMNGTSAAAPQVSGAVALLLERNPRLGYRDVKEILMRSARRDGLSAGDEFTRNGGGLFFSHSFGAGVLDVSAALELAGNWSNLGQLLTAEITAEGEAAIPDGVLDGVSATFDFARFQSLRVEHVELTVDVPHGNRGDLGIAIISPSGMVSIAEPREKDENEDFLNYSFTSVRHWGENSTGVWRVRVIDTAKNGSTGTLTKASLRIYGTAR